MTFERISSEGVWSGRIVEVRRDSFRYDDGGEATREIVGHPGAVSVVPFDGERFWLVTQPREPVGEAALLELPAGKLDVDGEDPLAAARRELSEEIGMAAREWRHLVSFYNSPGILTEEHHVYLATELYEERLETDEVERIEIVQIPLGELDATIGKLKDAKTLIGLLWFRAFIAGG